MVVGVVARSSSIKSKLCTHRFSRNSDGGLRAHNFLLRERARVCCRADSINNIEPIRRRLVAHTRFAMRCKFRALANIRTHASMHMHNLSNESKTSSRGKLT